MKRVLAFFLIFFSGFLLQTKSQQVAGVEEALIWLRPNAEGEWENFGTEKSEIIVKNTYSKEVLNYNWVPKFLSNQKITIPILKNIERATYIVAFHPKEKREQAIFSFLHDDDKLSTQSFFSRNRTFRYQTNSANKPTIASYVSIKEPDNKQIDSIFIGNSWQNIDSFSGTIAEFLVFDRVLTKLEREKIESYLSLKYSIPLSKEISLVAPNDDFLWEKSENQKYGNQVFGFGVDSLGLFHQIKSEGENNKDLVVSLSESSKENFIDNHYILWSSDKNDFLFEKSKSSTEKFVLAKTWAIAKIGENPLAVDLEVKTEGWDGNHPKNKSLWLRQNQTENSAAKFVKATTVEENKYQFSNLGLDQDKSGKDYFSFLFADNIIFNTEILEPSCDSSNPPGTISLEVFGGEAPFQLSLKNVEITEQFSFESRTIEIPVAKSGFYQLYITDKLGNTSIEGVNVSYADGPKVDIEPFYSLNHLGRLDFDFSNETNNYIYRWYKENEPIKIGNSVSINKPAFYTLQVEDKNGCQSKYGFLVDKFELKNIDDYFLYPNPVRSSEEFSLIYDLQKQSDLKAILYDTSGRILDQQKQTGLYGHFNFKAYIPGVYFVKVEDNKNERSFKVIVR